MQKHLLKKNYQKKFPKKEIPKKKSEKTFYFKGENQHKQITNHRISCTNRKKNPR